MGHSAFPKFVNCSETAMLVILGDAICQETHKAVLAFYDDLNRHPPQGVMTLIPAYCAVMVVYDPMLAAPNQLQAQMQDRLAAVNRESVSSSSKIIEIPVCYGGNYGPDLAHVADHCNMSSAEVISRHTARIYPIFMIGFSPGFPFLGNLDPALSTPRHATPRTRVPAGSVGIADAQTGIYPLASPGGWQIIGRTPLTLFRPKNTAPLRYQVGDRLRFLSISPEEYLRLKAKEAP